MLLTFNLTPKVHIPSHARSGQTDTWKLISELFILVAVKIRADRQSGVAQYQPWVRGRSCQILTGLAPLTCCQLMPSVRDLLWIRIFIWKSCRKDQSRTKSVEINSFQMAQMFFFDELFVENTLQDFFGNRKISGVGLHLNSFLLLL